MSLFPKNKFCSFLCFDGPTSYECNWSVSIDIQLTIRTQSEKYPIIIGFKNLKKRHFGSLKCPVTDQLCGQKIKQNCVVVFALLKHFC